MADALLGFDPDEDDKPEYVADGGLWKKAVKVIDPEGVGAKYDHPYRVAAALYKLMGGKFVMGVGIIIVSIGFDSYGDGCRPLAIFEKESRLPPGHRVNADARANDFTVSG